LASLITHPIVPVTLGLAAGQSNIPLKLLFVGILFSMLPDADVIAFRFGIPYEHMLGHRGFTHSLAFAAIIAAVAARAIRVSWRVFIFLFLCAASHGLLDAMTTGGEGVGFLIPFSEERYFFSWRPIRVSPIGVKAFFSERGWAVLKSEIVWVWVPCAMIVVLCTTLRKFISRA